MYMEQTPQNLFPVDLYSELWKHFTIIVFVAVNCTDEPPERPSSGTWEWSGGIEYATTATYTCGPYGNFENPGGVKYESVESVCAWNKTWSPAVLDKCVATYCQVIPFPPEETGMIFEPDPLNPITLQSEYTVYNPRLPLKMQFPQSFCGDNDQMMLIVGRIPRVWCQYLLTIIWKA